MLRSSVISILVAAAAVIAPPAASVAASGPPTGKYACYAYVGSTPYYNGTTVILKSGHHYTTKGAHFTGRYAIKGKKVIFRSGKLKGFKSLWRVDGSGTPALIIEFPNHSSTNTATCGRLT
jgi:hypothetical protein